MTPPQQDMTLQSEAATVIFATGLASCLKIQKSNKPTKTATMKRLIAPAVLMLLLLPSPALRAEEEITKATRSHENIVTKEETRLTVTGQPAPDNYVEAGTVSVQNPATGETTTHTLYEAPPESLYDLYREGGYLWMTLITLCLVAALLSTWKAPRWIKEFGLLALVLGIISLFSGIYDIAKLIGSEGIEIGRELPSSILFSGLRVGLIAPMWGLIVYGITLILRIALKPRI